MDLYNELKKDKNIILFISLLRGKIKEEISFRKSSNSIFIFVSINEKSSKAILQIMPNKDIEYTYSNCPIYQEEIKDSLNRFTKILNRTKNINKLLFLA